MALCTKTEWQLAKHQSELYKAERASDYTLYDHWHDIPEDAYLYSSAFTDCINHQATRRDEGGKNR